MERNDHQRIVITGVGLTAPNGNSLPEFRANLLAGKSGVRDYEIRYFGKTYAGLCDFDALKYQKRKEVRTGTRAGSIGVYCAHEALADAGLEIGRDFASDRIGVFLGITEHGNVETEEQIYEISKYNYQVSYWSHYHNPRTVANSPAGAVTVNLGITGPHYCLGGACAAGNLGLVTGMQQILLDEVDMALAGGVSESPGTFGIFAAFKAENSLAHDAPSAAEASRPFDQKRNGIVISEGGAVYVLERLDHAKARGAKIYAELLGHCYNSDATDMALPNAERQAQCIRKALANAHLRPQDIHIVNTHATGTLLGDAKECEALREVFGDSCPDTCINNTKGFIGHAMGAAAALELAGNLPSFQDNLVHHCLNVEQLDPQCALPNLVLNAPRSVPCVETILNNSFGMYGINCVLIVGKYQ
ncbi:MAG: beta-ketoacyl-[Victivallales bacterium]|nr:beta-ketoacyl-[acyl-carrier-protein] synthase family protein [Victivallales bacterium]